MNEVEFLNIDLDLASNSSLSILANELGDRVMFLRNEVEGGTHFISCEFDDDFYQPEPLLTIFLTLLENISDAAKAELSQCTKIVFDIGYQSGYKPRQINHSIAPEVLARLAKLNAQIAISVYGVAD